jgi:hypothetical protein
MKRLMLFSIAVGVGISAANAQIDTSRTKTTPEPTLQQPAPARTPTPAEQQNQYLNQNRTLINQQDIPSTMRETLQGTQYKGWENSSIYQNRNTGEYSIDIKNANTPLKTYRFDSNGRAIIDQGGSQPKRDQ